VKPKLTWCRRVFRIATGKDSGIRTSWATVRGYVSVCFAAHQTGRGWTLTHLPTGRRVVWNVRTLRTVKRIAAKLSELGSWDFEDASGCGIDGHEAWAIAHGMAVLEGGTAKEDPSHPGMLPTRRVA